MVTVAGSFSSDVRRPAAEEVAAYLDHAATTPVRPDVLAAMVPFLTERFGNPSGSHRMAREARLAIDEAREDVADALGCRPGEVVFTSGGTEADNLAVAGVVARRGGVPVCSAVEHHAVLRVVEALGGRVVGVDRYGVIDLDALTDALRPGDVSVVSVMAACNEVGTIQPLSGVVDVVRRLAPNAVVHTDAVHGFPWLDLAAADGAGACDLVTVSAHKVGGPKGTGVLVVRNGVEVEPLARGGGQERDLRSGTHDVAGIVGMAASSKATVAERADVAARVAAERDRFVAQLLGAVEGVVETVPADRKVPGGAHLLIDGVESESLLLLLDEAGVCASAGSACASGAIEPSHVLTAMGVAPEAAVGAVRFTLGASTTTAQLDRAADVVVDVVGRLRAGR